jgi:hypothetical protein
VGGSRVLAPDTTTAVKAMASLATCEAATGDPAVSTGPAVGASSSPPHMAATTASTGADDNVVDEPKVIMGHPGLRAPGTISLSEVMGTGHFALNQMHNVLHQEREDINKEQLRLSVWVSLLKQRTTFEKEKTEARQKHLNVMKILYSKRQVVADKLDAQTQKLLHDANATIKQQEDHNAQVVVMAQREQAVAEQELKLWEKEEKGNLRLEHELEALASCESDLNNREATLAAERKDLEETHTGALAHELTAIITDLRLNSREEELGDREKRLVERE